MKTYNSIDRNSKFYQIYSMGQHLHVELHPNSTSGGFFLIRNREEGEALVKRLIEGIESLPNPHDEKGEDIPQQGD